MWRKERLRVLADARLQGSLCLRVSMYWICCQIAVLLMLGCCSALQNPPASSSEWLQRMWTQYGQAMGASLLVLPLVLLDCLVFSNRFAGPMRRLLAAMRRLADGHPVPPIRFRSRDYYRDFAHEFNRILARIEMQNDKISRLAPTSETDRRAAAAPDREPEPAGLA